MKRIILFCLSLVVGVSVFAQNCYWVFFTDKNNTTFDPYQYFDAKAIERYQQLNLDLYDITNYPVNASYSSQVGEMTEELVGESRWLNAVAVMATEEEMMMVRALPFVGSTRLIATEAMLAQAPSTQSMASKPVLDAKLSQVALMQGEKFQAKGIDGKGVRIAVFDAGFPDVDTHPAFKHLRDNNQIVKTWNFAAKKEDVYSNHAHGRMVLSCIAGIMNDTTMLGLAPGAEFLLARTEIESEKKKEEVWWVQALEWADKNGAHIVSSSLGYGMALHSTKEMDGQSSIVAKGAKTAASKGILVCTAMGNEGNNVTWKVLITPADADSVLSVGAVRSLENMEIYSSFGPTADGRRKPNVVACGYDLVAMDKGNYDYSQGTSFATPMVSGFAACVRQMHPDWTVMQLIQEIEKSGNLYPYYDYAFGYGVPQASYFVDMPETKKPRFDLYEDDQFIYVQPKDMNDPHRFFYKIQNGDGSIENYETISYDNSCHIDSQAFKGFVIAKEDLKNGQSVNFWYDGQYGQYVVGTDKLPVWSDSMQVVCVSCYNHDVYTGAYRKPSADIFKMKKAKYVSNLVLNASFMIPSMWSPEGNIHQTDRISRSFSFSFENFWWLHKVYGLGFRIGLGSSWYAEKDTPQMSSDLTESDNLIVKKHNLKTTQFDLELFQRFKLANLSYSKLYLDMGVYGDWITGSRLKTKTQNNNQTILNVQKHYERDQMNKLNCGVRVRLGFTQRMAIYGQYRITSILKEGNDLPKWEVGIQIF